MRKKLIIYGASNPNIVKLIAAINERHFSWEIKGFLVDNAFHYYNQSRYMGFPILGGIERIDKLTSPDTYFINNIGSAHLSRRATSLKLDNANIQLATLIYPDVDITYATIGEGTIIDKGATIGANIAIGRHCLVRSNAIVNHDSTIGDYTTIGPGVCLSGCITIQQNAYLGTGCSVRERITIGENSIVGAGAVVVKPVKPNTTVVGIPAKEMQLKTPPVSKTTHSRNHHAADRLLHQ